MMELSELTLKVRELAVATGAFIREERKKFSRERIEKKHAHDYVSYVDKESERRIVPVCGSCFSRQVLLLKRGAELTPTRSIAGWLTRWTVRPTSFITMHLIV